jgi:hypothetical protein
VLACVIAALMLTIWSTITDRRLTNSDKAKTK